MSCNEKNNKRRKKRSKQSTETDTHVPKSLETREVRIVRIQNNTRSLAEILLYSSSTLVFSCFLSVPNVLMVLSDLRSHSPSYTGLVGWNVCFLLRHSPTYYMTVSLLLSNCVSPKPPDYTLLSNYKCSNFERKILIAISLTQVYLT